MSTFNVVDSSGWLEYLFGTERTDLFAPAIDDTAKLIVPIIIVYEVYKKMLRECGEAEARRAALVLQNGQVIDLDIPLVLEASRFQLPMADSLIYATALQQGATLWTQDEHFKDLLQVRYFPKQPAV